MKKRLLPLLLCALLALTLFPATALAADYGDSKVFDSSNGDGFTPYGVKWQDAAKGLLSFQVQQESYDHITFDMVTCNLVVTVYRDGQEVGRRNEPGNGSISRTADLSSYMTQPGRYETTVHLAIESVVQGQVARGPSHVKTTSDSKPAPGSTGKTAPGDVSHLVVAYEGCTHNVCGAGSGISEPCHVYPVSNYAADAAFNPVSGPGWSFAPATHTLTLNSFRGSAIAIMGPLAYEPQYKTPTVTLVLNGDSVITGTGDETYGALTADHVNLVIQGSGTLTLSGEQFGLFASNNNGDYKNGTLDGGRVTIKQGVTIKASSTAQEGSGLTSKELVVESGSQVALTALNSNTGGYAESLVMRGTLTAQCSAVTAYSTAFISQYCTVGEGVVIRGGKDAASAATVLKTRAPQTSPVYGAVTLLDYDAGGADPLPYFELRQGGGATTPAAPAAKTAYVQSQIITVDGKAVTFQTYALKDAAGNLTNYVKLRDVAHVLSGTAAQFNVAWDGSVNIETGKAYAPNGSEMKTPFSGDRAYADATSPTKIDGQAATLSAITLTDDSGAGYTYYKLRDLGPALGFQVDWSAETGITVDTGAGR